MAVRLGVVLLGMLLFASLALADSAAWTEGDNVKLNTDATSELQNEESMCINPNDPDNVIAIWRDFRLGYRRIGVGTSFDGGQTWSDSLFVGTPYPRHSDPVISFAADGTILACILSFENGLDYNGLFIYPSTDGGMTWGTPATVVDGAFGAFEDKQWINVDRTGGTYNGRIYVPWARFTAITQIMICYGDKFGSEYFFSEAVPISDSPSVQWPTVTVGSDGKVYVAWFSYSGNIMLDMSTNGGVSWGTDLPIQSTTFFPSEIDGGIQTFPFPAMEADISGGPYDNTVYIIFEDIAADGELDVYLTKSTNGGTTWSERSRIHDDPIGNNVDQFHPWLALNEDGILTAVWYDRRNDPANLYFDLYMAHSFDGGETWTANRRISEVSSSPYDAIYRAFDSDKAAVQTDTPGWARSPRRGHQERAGLIGEYVGLATVGNKANTVWTDARNGNQDVFGTRVTIGLAPPPMYSPSEGLATKIPQPEFSWGKTGATAAELAIFPGTQVEPVTYVLEIDDDPLFFSVDYVDSNLVGTTRQITSPLADGSWYWRVSAVSSSGTGSGYSEPHRLLMVDQTVPTLPMLLVPEYDSTISSETQKFLWSPVDKEDRGTEVNYQLQISADSTFATVAIDDPSLAMNGYITSGVLDAGETYYWRVRPYDEAGNSPGFTSMSRFHTERDYICGDADGNEIVNISDAVFLITYIFGGGPAPEPLESGDVDCNDIVNISDAVYLIAYIFGGGPSPCASCS